MSQLPAPPTSGSLGMSQLPAGGLLKLWERLSLRPLKIYEDSPRGAHGGSDAFEEGLAFDTRTPLCSPLCSGLCSALFSAPSRTSLNSFVFSAVGGLGSGGEGGGWSPPTPRTLVPRCARAVHVVVVRLSSWLRRGGNYHIIVKYIM